MLWDHDRAFDSCALFGAEGMTYLIGMEGQVVHTWPLGTNPRLLPNANLLDATRDDPSGLSGFRELDWDGKVVWEYAVNAGQKVRR